MTDDPKDPCEPVLLTIDPERKQRLTGDTGIFIRARFEGRWGTHDILHLDRISLVAWLRSRGGDNPWAESVVCTLLGHRPGD